VIPLCEGVHCLHERPSINASRPARLLIRIAAPLLRPLNAIRRNIRRARLPKLLEAATRCTNRSDIESCLGRPAYAMDGSLYEITDKAGKSRHPDYVEVYVRSGCSIDLLFFTAEERIEAFGVPSPTLVDTVLRTRGS